MGAFIYIYIMMDVLVKARTGLLGYFLCVVSVLLLASCGLDLFSSDKDDDKECAETVEKVPLEPGLEELGGYALQQSIHYIYSDTLEFDMHVSVVEDGYDRSGCPDAQVIYGYRRVVLEGPNPLAEKYRASAAMPFSTRSRSARKPRRKSARCWGKMPSMGAWAIVLPTKTALRSGAA